jgi:hypothetical protein
MNVIFSYIYIYILYTDICSTCQQDVFTLLVPSLSQVVNANGLFTTCYEVAGSTGLLQVVPTTCYRPAIRQFVNKLRVTTL